MPEITSASQSVTETQAALAAAPVQTDPNAAPPQVPANAAQREALQTKYDALYGTPAEQKPTAQPAPAAPATPAAPAVPDYSGAIEALKAELATLRAAQPKPVEAAKPTEADWLALLAAGDKEGGEKAMADRIRALIGADIQANAVNQATERINAERQINDFVSEVRSKNADILVMEQAITLGAQARIASAAQAGKINTPSDYVAVYKDAVNAEIENARNLILSIRGQGKLEGATRVSEVIASSTLQPNAVTQSRENAQAPQAEAFDDTQTYLAKRAALKAQQQGM